MKFYMSKIKMLVLVLYVIYIGVKMYNISMVYIDIFISSLIFFNNSKIYDVIVKQFSKCNIKRLLKLIENE